MNQNLIANQTLSHYRIVSKLGAGGMGEVWLAEDTRLKRKVALKLLPAELTADAERVHRFEQEAQAASALSHPNIITVFDIGDCDAGRFIVMELVAGHTLRRTITEDNSLDTFLSLSQQMAKALSAAHAAGITHRDIKPDNVMVREDGYVKVLDFGLARLRPATESDSEAATLAQQTAPGTVMGTVAYMSPEQARGETVGHPSDVFALGIVLYELITGRHPFKAETMIGYLHAITLQTPAPPQQWQPKLPVALNDLLLRMLSKDASQRPNASEVAQALQSIERGGDLARAQPLESATMVLPNVKSGAPQTDAGFWVAVLPFKWRGASAELEALAEGLSEDIVTGLSRFSYLRVIARSSTLKHANDAGDVRAMGRELGARYVMEGSLRQAGAMLRVAVQLVDANTGAHLWAESYNRTFVTDEMFELQDTLSSTIVSTIADMNGVLPRSMSQAVRSKPPEQLSPYEAVLRSFAYFELYTPEELAVARAGLETAVQNMPGYADAWAMLSYLCAQDYIHGYELQANALEIAVSAARRAVELAATNHLAFFSLAQALWAQKDFDSFRDAAERAFRLNPMDGNSVALLGEYLLYAGIAQRGLQLAERAKHLNPDHPGSYWYPDFYHAFSQGDYRSALAFAQKAKLGGNPLASMFIAAASGQLGDAESGAKAISELLKFRPTLPLIIRKQVAKVWNPEYGERFLEGLRKAGMKLPGDTQPATKIRGSQPSGESRANEGFWVAVLPFKSMGVTPEIAALADGLSEDIVTGLSRFSYLRVIARGSTLKYTNDSSDLRTIGKELGVRYVMEGSLRQAGTKLRLAVQLVDAATGAHLWVENYERSFSPESVFELQDDLVPRIVSTVADQYGALVHSMSEALRGKSAASYSAHEAVLRAFGYWERVTPEEHREAREILEAAVARAPGHSDCLAMLSTIYWHEYAHGYNVRPDPLGRAYAAAQRAVAAAPTSQLAHYVLASVLFFQKDFPAFRAAAERTLPLNRMDASTTAALGFMFAYAGDWDYGLGLVERAMHLNPHHPGWYHLPAFYNAYRTRDYRGALESALKINVPGYFWPQVVLAIVYGQLGEQQRARAALQALQALMPNFGAVAREEFGKWFDAELTEHLIDGLRKAGLAIDGKAQVASSQPVTAANEAEALPLATSETQSATSPTQSIAVLPFANISADEENEYFCDGLAEELLNALAKIDELKVAARTSAFSFKDKNAEAREIGKTLNVNTVLEGSVRKSGHRIRINVQLVNAADGYQLWSERYDREMKDIFDVQDEITLAVVAALKVKLLGAKKAAVLKRYTNNTEAYELYLKGRFHNSKWTEAGYRKAIDYYEQALCLEPNYAPAYAGLADACGLLWYWGFDTRPEMVARQRAAVTKALQLDDSLADVWRSQALLQSLIDWDFLASGRSFAQALRLNPNDALAHTWHSFWLIVMGHCEQSVLAARRARILDPFAPFVGVLAGWSLWFAQQYDEAHSVAQALIEIDPHFAEAYRLLGCCQLGMANYAAAETSMQKALAEGGSRALADLCMIYAHGGKTEQARQILRQLHEQRDSVPALWIAYGHIGLGEVEEAFVWLEKALAEHNGELFYFGVLPEWLITFRQDPRCAELLRHIGFPTNEAQPPVEAQTLISPPITDYAQTENKLYTAGSDVEPPS